MKHKNTDVCNIIVNFFYKNVPGIMTLADRDFKMHKENATEIKMKVLDSSAN